MKRPRKKRQKNCWIGESTTVRASREALLSSPSSSLSLPSRTPAQTSPGTADALFAGARAFVCLFLWGERKGGEIRRELVVLPLLTHSHTHTRAQAAGSVHCKSASPHSSGERGNGRDGKEKINRAKRACCRLRSLSLLSPSLPPILPLFPSPLQFCHLFLFLLYKYL